MPADVEVLDTGQWAMAYNMDEGVPWHGMGQSAAGAMTALEAITLAELDWKVAKEQAERKGVIIPDKFWVVRQSDDKVLGVVGKDYKPIQNGEAFDFFDTLVDSGEAKYETAGSLSGGKRIFLTAHIGDDMQIAGQDSHRMYLALISSHDGSKSLQAVTTMIRVVCANTETMALKSAKTSWSMTHRQTLAGKVAEARDALKLSFKYRDEFTAEVERMMQVQITTDKFREIMTDILPAQPRQLPKNLDALTARFEGSPTIVDAGLGGTGYGAYNAVTEWLTWGREVRSQEARMVNTIWGFGASTRGKTRDAILALA